MVELINNHTTSFTYTISQVTSWFNDILFHENVDKVLSPITIVLGDDEWLLNYNKTYLNHDYYTDIITFDYSDDTVVSGDLLISIDRVYDNSNSLNVSRETELARVIIHGFLHLIGFKDDTNESKLLMRSKEDFYLNKFLH